MRLRYAFPCVIGMLVFVALIAEPARAQDETAFTADLARSFSAAMPEATVSIKSPLTLSLNIPKSSGTPDTLQVNLDRVWAYCRRNSQDCQRGITEFVTRTAQTIRQQEAPVEKEKVFLIIRSERTVQSFGSETPVKPVAEPIAGDLWLVCVIDGEPGARIFTGKHLTNLALSQQDVISLAKSNLARHLPPINKDTHLASDGTFGFVGGDPYYAASRIALHEQWAPLAERMKGQLLVTVPDGGMIFFADSSIPLAVHSLRKASSDTAKTSQRPISPAILVWTKQGWQEWKQ